jgi:hypothetical protein
VRKGSVTAAWTRAILLGKISEARTLAAMVKTELPELAGVMNGYLAAEPPAAQFAAVYAMLRTPGFSPWLVSGFGRDGKIAEMSDFRDNWWHSLEPATVSAKFLPDVDRTDGAADWKALSASNGANYLAAETVKYVKANPADPRAAQALALAVRATHFSTTNDETGSFSKQAFDLLHAEYPNTTFAKTTKYWYK